MSLPEEYTPLTAPYPMSWPPRDCCWCGDKDMVWAYPIGEVAFWRTVKEGEPQQEIRHASQPWYACARCKTHIDAGSLDSLAEELGRPRGYWDRLRAARLRSPGYPWGLTTRRR